MGEVEYNPIVRLSEMPMEDGSEGGFRSKDAFVGKALQLTRLGCNYTEVAPGDTACPFHVHHAEDEMFVVLGGEGEYRFGTRTYEIRAGDVLGAPLGGPDHAHQIFNTGTEPLRYLAISSLADLDVLQFPDSGKFLVSSRAVAGTARKRFFYKGREEDMADNYEGEVTEQKS